jgi:hypothetical protein
MMEIEYRFNISKQMPNMEKSERTLAKYYSQLGLGFICGVSLLIYGDSMSKVIKFIRERTPFILVVYGAYIYFHSYSRELLQIF